jgi:hypothetical protein
MAKTASEVWNEARNAFRPFVPFQTGGTTMKRSGTPAPFCAQKQALTWDRMWNGGRNELCRRSPRSAARSLKAAAVERTGTMAETKAPLPLPAAARP